VNNYDWMKEYSFLDFIRDIGKHLTVNYMMAKDSVKTRLSAESSEGMSFTEFSYQLVQGTDFLTLYQDHNCKLQMGGSDQWGNILTGTELIRRKLGHEENAFALTCPLITKADGSKFGKTETGNVWLDPEKTSPYSFYQFWINTSDEDAERYIKIFTLLDRQEIEDAIEQHKQAPHLRHLQKLLAREITILIHSEQAYHEALKASEILFGNASAEDLEALGEKMLAGISQTLPLTVVAPDRFREGIPVVDFIEENGIAGSKREAREFLKNNAISLNKTKVNSDLIVTADNLLFGKYILAQRGKKKYFMVICE
jgi:tyrosyl-tRNA synthetase